MAQFSCDRMYLEGHMDHVHKAMKEASDKMDVPTIMKKVGHKLPKEVG